MDIEALESPESWHVVTEKELPDIPYSQTQANMEESIRHETALKHGLLSTQKRELTILLVGETGVGKTALVDLIGNVLRNKRPRTYRNMRNMSNEGGGSKIGSQTHEAHIYEFRSQDSISVRLLDTPGLADTRGIEQDEQHKASVVRVIRDSIPMVDSVLIVVNGATERLQVATDYAITTLASILPRSIAANIAIVFTMVRDPQCFNFQRDSLPSSLRNCKVFLLDNPTALMARYQDPIHRLLVASGQLSKMLRLAAVGDAHANAVGMLTDLFSWLDHCTVLSTSAIVRLYESVCTIDRRTQNALPRTNDISRKRRDVQGIMADISRTRNLMRQNENFETHTTGLIKVQTQTPQNNVFCSMPDCYSNCHTTCNISSGIDAEALSCCHIFSGGSCTICRHPTTDHRLDKLIWEERTDRQVKVNEDARGRFHSAAQEMEKLETDLNPVEAAIKDLDSEIECLKTEIGALYSSYRVQSPLGCFSEQISKSVQLLQLNLETLRMSGADERTIQTVTENITTMRQKQGFLAAVVRNVHFIPPDSMDGDNEPDGPFKALRKGFLWTKKRELTILLVGQTGVGKTALLNFIANVLDGRGPKTYQVMQDASNERGGSRDQSQTNEAHLYQFRSLNGIKIRLLDTPGLADTRGMRHDEHHMASIANIIREEIPVIDGMLILTNGTTERLQVATDYAITTLTSILPPSITDNIGIIFTMVANPLQFNFQLESLPSSLQKSIAFLLDNPIALMERYTQREREQLSEAELSNMFTIVSNAHANAVETFSKFFDWLDLCTIQSTSAIVELYENVCTIDRHIQDAIDCVNIVLEEKREVERIKVDISTATQLMRSYEDFETTLTRTIKVMTGTPHHNILCERPDCYSNCHIQCELSFTFNPDVLRSCTVMRNGSCTKCHHPVVEHRHYNEIWEDKTEPEVVVDDVARRNFDLALQQRSIHEGALGRAQATIDTLNAKIDGLKINIGMRCNSYQGLSLSGGISGQISQSVRLLELMLEPLQVNGTHPERIQIVDGNLNKMRQKQELVDGSAAIVTLYERVCTIDLRIYNALARISIISQKKKDIGKISREAIAVNLNYYWQSQLIKAYEELQSIMNRPIKVKVHSDDPYHNTLCLWPQCYASCHSKCHDTSFSFDADFFKSCTVMKDGRCTICRHPTSDHRQYKAIWREKTDCPVVVDKVLKSNLKMLKKLHTGSSHSQKSRIKTALLNRIREAEKDIQLDSQIEDLKTDVGTLCSSYQALSLLGSFSRQISDSVRLFQLYRGAFQARGDETMSNLLQELGESIAATTVHI